MRVFIENAREKIREEGEGVKNGQKAFEAHFQDFWENFRKNFQQWRHAFFPQKNAYGLKCLKIPNTVHFLNVTDFEQARKALLGFLGGPVVRPFCCTKKFLEFLEIIIKIRFFVQARLRGRV